jgi:hypothetical protein
MRAFYSNKGVNSGTLLRKGGATTGSPKLAAFNGGVSPPRPRYETSSSSRTNTTPNVYDLHVPRCRSPIACYDQL